MISTTTDEQNTTLGDVISKGLKKKLEVTQDQEHIRKYWNESNLRTVVHEMLQPLIKNQLQNQQDVNKAMEEMAQLREIHSQQEKLLDETVVELQAIPSLSLKLKDLADSVSMDGRQSKATTEGLNDKIERNRDRMNQISRDMQRFQGELAMRDEKILSSQEIIASFKDKVNTEITQFIRQITRDLDTYSVQTNKAHKDIYQMENFFKSSKAAVDNFSKELSQLQYASDKHDKRLQLLDTHEMPHITEKLSKLEKSSDSHDYNIKDIYNQLKLLRVALDCTNVRVTSLENYIDRSLPQMMDMRISSYVGEFLSVQDRMRQREVDNKRIKELQDYINKFMIKVFVIETPWDRKDQDLFLQLQSMNLIMAGFSKFIQQLINIEAVERPGENLITLALQCKQWDMHDLVQAQNVECLATWHHKWSYIATLFSLMPLKYLLYQL